MAFGRVRDPAREARLVVALLQEVACAAGGSAWVKVGSI